MLRTVVRAIARTRLNQFSLFTNQLQPAILKPCQQYHNLTFNSREPQKYLTSKSSLLQNPEIVKISQNIRPLTKFSLRKGKRKTVKAVLKRFYRLEWGGWIRTKSGRNKKLWKKSENQKRRLRQHVFTNGTQSWLLDKMVTKYWRRPKYYVEDPYEPFHKREEFYVTRKKPQPI